MQRPTKSQEEAATRTGVTDEMFAKKYPTLLQFMTDDKWDDGKTRETSTVVISIQAGSFQLGLNDKALKQSVYCTAPTIQEGLKLLEGVLTTGEAPWRPWKHGKK